MENTHEETSRDSHDLGREDEGQSLAEYALILALVSLTAVGFTPVGQWLALRLGELAAAL